MTVETPRKASGEFLTHSPQETVRLGKILGELLAPGDVVALIGDLGAGKTTLAKGIACGAGVEDEGDVTSPTFVLVNEYQGRFPVYHADLYRLQDVNEAEDLGWEEFIFGNGISLVEWAEKIPEILPDDRIEIRISWLNAEERKLNIAGKGVKGKNIIRLLRSKWEKEE
jgi:tRNA threonylcarbamoyladenosine biosynthesis protein TsaE